MTGKLKSRTYNVKNRFYFQGDYLKEYGFKVGQPLQYKISFCEDPNLEKCHIEVFPSEKDSNIRVHKRTVKRNTANEKVIPVVDLHNKDIKEALSDAESVVAYLDNGKIILEVTKSIKALNNELTQENNHQSPIQGIKNKVLSFLSTKKKKQEKLVEKYAISIDAFAKASGFEQIDIESLFTIETATNLAASNVYSSAHRNTFTDFKNQLEKKSLKMLSLFSGIGAFEEALKNIGVDFEVVGFSEIDKFAIESYCAIHGVNKNRLLGDITKINIDNIPDVNLITHGSPCQDYSQSGLNKGGDEGSGTRSSLMWNSVKIIQKKLPKYVIWENVAGGTYKKHIHNIQRYINDLACLGYKSYMSLLNSSSFGIPQNRERVFIVSIKGAHEPFVFPKKTIDLPKLQDFMDERVEDKYYHLKPCVATNIEREMDKILISKKDIYQCKCKTAFQDNKIGINLIPTLRASSSYSLILDKRNRVRRITPEESWRVQGFLKSSFLKAKNAGISDHQLFKQAGNSITVNVLVAIFKSLFNIKEKLVDNVSQLCNVSKNSSNKTYKYDILKTGQLSLV